MSEEKLTSRTNRASPLRDLLRDWLREWEDGWDHLQLESSEAFKEPRRKSNVIPSHGKVHVNLLLDSCYNN